MAKFPLYQVRMSEKGTNGVIGMSVLYFYILTDLRRRRNFIKYIQQRHEQKTHPHANNVQNNNNHTADTEMA